MWQEVRWAAGFQKNPEENSEKGWLGVGLGLGFWGGVWVWDHAGAEAAVVNAVWGHFSADVAPS